MMPLKEIAVLYSSGVTVGNDLNVTPNALSVIAPNLRCNLHRASQRSKDEAAAIGVFNVQTADAFFAVSSANLLDNRKVLKDSFGTFWIIRNVSVRNRFPATAHVRALLTELEVTPDGG